MSTAWRNSRTSTPQGGLAKPNPHLTAQGRRVTLSANPPDVLSDSAVRESVRPDSGEVIVFANVWW